MSGDSVTGLLVMLGKAQVDAVFCRQADYPVDDSEFLPLVEAVLAVTGHVEIQGHADHTLQ